MPRRWRARRRPASAPPASPARSSPAPAPARFAFDGGERRLGRAAGRQLPVHGPRLRRQRADAGAPRFEHALFVKSQVMSRGAAHAVVDAGHKSHAIDSGLPRVWQRELDVRQRRRRARHPAPGAGAARRACRRSARRSGSVPGHCDPTVNLHERYVVRARRARSMVSSRRCGRSRRAAASADRTGPAHDRPADHRPRDAGLPGADRHRVRWSAARAAATATA